MRKFIIFAPPYNEKQGGVICLHKLTHLINEMGYEAYIFPSFENIEINKFNFLVPALRFLRSLFRSIIPFKTYKYFNTPIYKGSFKNMRSDDWVVVYYEQVFGNPLRAKNVVRWLLHQPAYHTGAVYYGFNELYVRFNEAVRPFIMSNSKLADFYLPIIHYPLEIYNEKDAKEDRVGTAYCIRKGKGKEIQHDLGDSILIDNLSHDEIANIFRKVKMFVSYDSYTAYSRFAALCGCDSVVIPDKDISEIQWYPNPVDRYGVAYGFENIEKARLTKGLLKERVMAEHQQSSIAVQQFVEECLEYFDEPRYSLFRAKHVK